MITNKFVHYYVVSIILAMLVILQVYFLNTYSTSGQQISDLQKEIESIENQNVRLQTQIASDSAMLAISIQSESIGINKSLLTVSLKSPLPVAYRVGQSM